MPSGACTARSPGRRCTTGSFGRWQPPGRSEVTAALTARQQSGQRAEELAATFLRSQGFDIIERNYRRRLGELDIVARRGALLVIAEVRTRSSTAYGGAAGGPDAPKQRRPTPAAPAAPPPRGP